MRGHVTAFAPRASASSRPRVRAQIAQRYKRAKLVGTPAQPPLLEGPAESDGIKWALAELPKEQIAEALVAHGIDPSDDAAANIDALAIVLI